MVEMVEILDGRLGKHSVERVWYVINNLLHLVIVKYGVISLVLCISTRLRLETILLLLVKYLVIFHADPCNKSYIHISREILQCGARFARSIILFKGSFSLKIACPYLKFLHLGNMLAMNTIRRWTGKLSPTC